MEKIRELPECLDDGSWNRQIILGYSLLAITVVQTAVKDLTSTDERERDSAKRFFDNKEHLFWIDCVYGQDSMSAEEQIEAIMKMEIIPKIRKKMRKEKRRNDR